MSMARAWMKWLGASRCVPVCTRSSFRLLKLARSPLLRTMAIWRRPAPRPVAENPATVSGPRPIVRSMMPCARA